ncbi:MAG TPA: 6-pyruvoyl tetrahydrobiopterin synthase [Bacteroidales bacterium]|jgi:6-pyruvoyltetrahydropterin/6-carboxytetrahydropterin synthase|nr:6-pyruvoyl tetrahydrobiopterin synthase [Bacteroidales bacterium]
MPVAYLTRRERFSSAHRLFKPDLTDEENFELYGQCSHPNWHGHNYQLFVTIKGEINDTTGYVLNLKHLSELIKKEIIEKVDHKNLNVDVDFLSGIIPSTENIAVFIWNKLKNPIKNLGAEIHRVKIQETENNYVEYFGE